MASPKPVQMAETRAPERMHKSYPNEFTPKAIFFLTPTTSSTDWNDCFNIKASAVYFAIFDQYAHDPKTLNAAVFLLKAIAKNCDNPINENANAASGEANDNKTLIETAETEMEYLSDRIKITIDAVYLVISILRDIKMGADANNEREKLDKYCSSRHGTHVLSDIAMLDNQLPLDLLINVVRQLPKAVSNTHSQLVKSRLSSQDQKNLNHSQLKDLLSSMTQKYLNSLKKFDLSFNEYNFPEVISLFSWYYSPFYASKMKYPKRDLLGKKTLFECMHHCLVQSEGTNITDKSPSTTRVWPILTAKELRKAGIRFEATTDWPVTVKFTPPSLKLPVLFYDSKLETVAMNLLALESWSSTTRPITRYYQMMNELVDDVRDARALKKFGVVRGWRKEDDVVSFVKKVDGFASYPSMYPAIDAEMDEVKKFYDDRMNRFLGRFRPDNSWVPYVAVASVILTAIVVTKRRG